MGRWGQRRCWGPMGRWGQTGRWRQMRRWHQMHRYPLRRHQNHRQNRRHHHHPNHRPNRWPRRLLAGPRQRPSPRSTSIVTFYAVASIFLSSIQRSLFDGLQDNRGAGALNKRRDERANQAALNHGLCPTAARHHRPKSGKPPDTKPMKQARRRQQVRRPATYRHKRSPSETAPRMARHQNSNGRAKATP